MASLINPTDSRKTAFVRGFWKGMAAPLVLFSSFDLPAQAVPMTFRPLERRAHNPASDWIRAGQSLRQAAKKIREEGGI